ncbi:unnamed protein product, partial [Heterotrigona itama]
FNPFHAHGQDLTHVPRCYLGGRKAMSMMTIVYKLNNFLATDDAWYKWSMPLVSGFTLRFFEFITAVAVVDRSRAGPETNVDAGMLEHAHANEQRSNHYDRWSSVCIE